MLATFINDETYEGTWLEPYYGKDISLYMLSMYWATTTVTTVGYGDIGGTNDFERFFCTMVEIIGVIGFALASSSLTSIITNYDQTNAEYQQKFATLKRMRQDHKIPFKLFQEL